MKMIAENDAATFVFDNGFGRFMEMYHVLG